MFGSIFQNGTAVEMVLLMAGIALAVGIISSLLYSIKIRGSKGFFVTSCLLPLIISIGICLIGAFLQGSTSVTARIVTIAITLGLIKFRSEPGKSEELLALLSEVVIGLVLGLGFVFLGGIFGVVIPALFVLFMYLPIFQNKTFKKERLLRITVPESLDYSGVFDDIFKEYFKESELVEVKTTNLGSMFRLSYRVIFKDVNKQKALMDDIRTRNGNLEVAILPFVAPKEL